MATEKEKQNPAMELGLIAAGAIVSGVVQKKVVPASMAKFAPFALIALGGIGAIMSDNSHVRNLSKGIASFGAVAVASSLASGNPTLSAFVPTLAGVDGLGNVDYDQQFAYQPVQGVGNLPQFAGVQEPTFEPVNEVEDLTEVSGVEEGNNSVYVGSLGEVVTYA